MKFAIGLCIVALSTSHACAGGFEDACVNAIKLRLKAPATYKEVSARRSVEELTVNEYAAGDQAIFDKYIKSEIKPVRHVVTVTYDASNSFGVPIRSVAKCTSDAIGNEQPIDNDMLVKVDGLTNIEWAARLAATRR